MERCRYTLGFKLTLSVQRGLVTPPPPQQYRFRLQGLGGVRPDTATENNIISQFGAYCVGSSVAVLFVPVPDLSTAHEVEQASRLGLCSLLVRRSLSARDEINNNLPRTKILNIYSR